MSATETQVPTMALNVTEQAAAEINKGIATYYKPFQK